MSASTSAAASGSISSTMSAARSESSELRIETCILGSISSSVCGGDFFVEGLEDGFALGRRQVFHDVGDVGGMQLRQAVERDLQLDPARGIGLDQIDELPGNHAAAGSWPAARAAAPAGTIPFSRRRIAPRAPTSTAASLSMTCSWPTLLVDVDVVDPHDLAAMYVDDLLVEQIALQQQQPFAVAVRRPLGRQRADAHAAVDGADGLGIEQPVAETGS